MVDKGRHRHPITICGIAVGDKKGPDLDGVPSLRVDQRSMKAMR